MSSTVAAPQFTPEKRFEFGKNWQQFIKVLTPGRIGAAESSLKSMLNCDSLGDKTFLDIGSGSGLFSLAARRLGAQVHSFDYDLSSVECTRELRQSYFPDDSKWWVERGSVLDAAYLQSLPKFDIVYSWGVLHHTGAMWQAIEKASGKVKDRGLFFIALYNDQGGFSRRWAAIKKFYVSLPRGAQSLLSGCCFAWIYWKRMAKGALRGRPFKAFENDYRGMSVWRDVVDWVGGYPFEVAQPGDVFEFLHARGFELIRMITTHGSGCNEFLFRKNC